MIIRHATIDDLDIITLIETVLFGFKCGLHFKILKTLREVQIWTSRCHMTIDYPFHP